MPKKGPQEQIVTNKLDPSTERYRNEVFNRARDVSNQGYSGYQGPTVAGPDALSTGAAQGIQGMPGAFDTVLRQLHGGGPNVSALTGAGNTGAAALGGDQGAIERLMNPYQRNVIDAMGAEFDHLRGKASMGANAEATAGGAFGGSRHAVMTGERLGALDRAQGSQIADLLHGGYRDMMSNAGVAANLGLGANQLISSHGLGVGGLGLEGARGRMDALGRQFGMGDYFRGLNQAGMDDQRRRFEEQRDWGVRNLEILKGGMTGTPYGNTTTQPLHDNRFNAAAGGAATGFGIGGPVGAGIGFGAGLLFG